MIVGDGVHPAVVRWWRLGEAELDGRMGNRLDIMRWNANCRRGGQGSSSVTGFTLIELLVVISIIGVLASLVVGLAGMAGKKGKESRVRAELNQLVTAIEDYKAKIGYYPPDNVMNRATRVVNPIANPLFYELSGMVIAEAKSGSFAFETPNRDERLDAETVRKVFNVEGFVNSARTAAELKFRWPFKQSQFAELSLRPDVDVLIVPVPWPKKYGPGPVPSRPGLNPWRYVSSNPTNNPGRFDLWAEYMVGGKTNIICNWSPDTIVVGKR